MMLLIIGVLVFMFAGYMTLLKKFKPKPMSESELAWQYTLVCIKKGRRN